MHTDINSQRKKPKGREGDRRPTTPSNDIRLKNQRIAAAEHSQRALPADLNNNSSPTADANKKIDNSTAI